MTKDELKMLRELASKATKVVAWYPHGPGDQCAMNEATVRGPFHRWMVVRGGDHYPTFVSHPEDDANFCAAAMNNLVPLLDHIAALEARLSEKQNVPDTHVLEKERLEHPYTMVCSNCQCGLTWHTRRPVTKCPECGAPPMKDAEGDNHAE